MSPADKGAAIVLWNRSDYLAEGYRQLNDDKYYKRITFALTNNNCNSILCVLKRMRRLGQISQSQFSFLIRSPGSIKQRKYNLQYISQLTSGLTVILLLAERLSRMRIVKVTTQLS